MQKKVFAMLRDHVNLHIIVLIWGFTGILGAKIHLPAIDLVIYRTCIACAGFALVLRLTGVSMRENQATIFKLIGVGLLVGLHWVLFFAAVKTGGASIGMIGLSTATLWSALISPFFLRKRISLIEITLGMVVILGLAYIFRAEKAHVKGLILSILAGLAASVFSHLNGQFTKRIHHHVISFYEMIGAGLTCLLALIVAGPVLAQRDWHLQNPSNSDMAYLLLLGLACTVYPYAASVELLKRLSVFTANLTVNLEPVYGMILAAIFLGEHHVLTHDFYIGGAVTVTAVIAYPLINFFRGNPQKLEDKAIDLEPINLETINLGGIGPKECQSK
ncbi:MAG: DMT family transporter [Proteobacteria bacterium]|nr:DMT family transporter [Pseudomonadota bacterium]